MGIFFLELWDKINELIDLYFLSLLTQPHKVLYLIIPYYYCFSEVKNYIIQKFNILLKKYLFEILFRF